MPVLALPRLASAENLHKSRSRHFGYSRKPHSDKVKRKRCNPKRCIQANASEASIRKNRDDLLSIIKSKAIRVTPLPDVKFFKSGNFEGSEEIIKSFEKLKISGSEESLASGTTEKIVCYPNSGVETKTKTSRKKSVQWNDRVDVIYYAGDAGGLHDSFNTLF